MDEILVHITAPTTRKQDELYRSLADAYRAFEPRPVDSSGPSKGKGHDVPSPTQPSPSLNAGTSHIQPKNTPSFMSKESYGSFPSQVSSGPADMPLDQRTPRSSFNADDSSLLSSSRLAQLERLQSNWRSKQTPRSSGSVALRSSGRTNPAAADDDILLEDSQLAAQALQSQLPDDNDDGDSTASEDSSDDEFGGESFGSLLSKLSDGELPISEPPTAVTHRESQAMLRNRHSDLHHGDTPTPTPTPTMVMTPVFSPPSPNNGGASVDPDEDVSSEPLDFSNLPFEVLPPNPEISTRTPEQLPSQATPYLGAIKHQNKGRFKPGRRLRALATDERGCWLVETARWPQRTQFEFWTSLCDHVRSGRLGWGVFLYRDAQNNGDGRGLGQVRMYCWGEVVEEMWLVLWLCSQGKICGSGPRWLDAEEAVVVQVP